MNPYREHALRMREKYDFYVVALVFTTLAFSLQTANMGVSYWADGAEFAAWLLLFLAGLIGLERLWYLPDIFDLRASLDETVGDLVKARALRKEGKTEVPSDFEPEHPYELEDFYSRAAERHARLSSDHSSETRASRCRHTVLLGAFLFGISMLIASRGAVPLFGATGFIAIATIDILILMSAIWRVLRTVRFM